MYAITEEIIVGSVGELASINLPALYYGLIEFEEGFKLQNGKYEQLPSTKSGGTTTEVSEYVCADGGVGYQVFVTVEVEGKKMAASFGVGPESGDRSFGWVEMKEEEYA